MFVSKTVIKRSNLESWFKRDLKLNGIYHLITFMFKSIEKNSSMSFRIQKKVNCRLVLPIAMLRSHMIFFLVNKHERLLFNVTCNVRYVLQCNISFSIMLWLLCYLYFCYIYIQLVLLVYNRRKFDETRSSFSWRQE